MSDKFLPVVKELQYQAAMWRETAIRRRRSPNGYKLDQEDIADLAVAFRAIQHGDKQRGMRALEDILDDIEPRWRDW